MAVLPEDVATGDDPAPQNRVNGRKGHREKIHVSDEARAAIWRLKDLGQGRRTIPASVGLSENVVRRVLDEPRPD